MISSNEQIEDLGRKGGTYLTIGGKVHKVYCSTIRGGKFGVMPWDSLAEGIKVGDKIWRDRLPYIVTGKEFAGLHYLVVCQQGESLTGVIS